VPLRSALRSLTRLRSRPPLLSKQFDQRRPYPTRRCAKIGAKNFKTDPVPRQERTEIAVQKIPEKISIEVRITKHFFKSTKSDLRQVQEPAPHTCSHISYVRFRGTAEIEAPVGSTEHDVNDPLLSSALQHFCVADSLFNHLVGATKQCERERDAERLSGLHVDDQLDFRRLLHRQVGGFGARRARKCALSI